MPEKIWEKTVRNAMTNIWGGEEEELEIFIDIHSKYEVDTFWINKDAELDIIPCTFSFLCVSMSVCVFHSIFISNK